MAKESEKVEEIRQRMLSLLNDCALIRRRIRRLPIRRSDEAIKTLDELKQIADRIDTATRELYHLLPPNLVPPHSPYFHAPRIYRFTGAYVGRSRPAPGGAIPHKVRWPDWTVERILELADEFHAKYGSWPNNHSGRINESSADTWSGVCDALQHGFRGLPGGTTLARLLGEQRGVINRTNAPDFEIEQILAWADDHFAQTGKWPNVYSGRIVAFPEYRWRGIDKSLRYGYRGLEEGLSLAALLERERGVPNVRAQRQLTVEEILDWADAHVRHTGNWPQRTSGTITESPSETWAQVNAALINGHRGLNGGSSLSQILNRFRGIRNTASVPKLTVEIILKWADRHHEEMGVWPIRATGVIPNTDGECWMNVDAALKTGNRGLAGCGYSSLASLLEKRRGKTPYRKRSTE